MLARNPRSLVPALVFLAPLPLLAAGSATLQSGQEIHEIHWQDAQTVRVDIPAENGYMVLRDGKTYMVNAGAGMPQVMEVGGMVRGLVDTLASDDAGGDTSPLSQSVQSMKKTGQTETVAGIKGSVYEATLVNGKGETTHETLVLTSDPLVTEMTDAFFGVSASMVGPEHVADFMTALPQDQRGLLRMGDEMTVQAINKQAPAADAFALPAEPVSFGDLMGELMKQHGR